MADEDFTLSAALPPSHDAKIFESRLYADDEKAIRNADNLIRLNTMEMTGTQINQRLSRFDAEIKRIEQLKAQIVRAKRATKGAILTLVADEDES